MLDLKKYFTEGLIDLSILLSFSGFRVDVGLEQCLPRSLYETILGQTSAMTQTQFQHSLDPKSVDLKHFFTARRLLGWVYSLDRIQVRKHVIMASFVKVHYKTSILIRLLNLSEQLFVLNTHHVLFTYIRKL